MTYIIETGMYNKYSFQSIFDNTILVFIRGMCTEKAYKLWMRNQAEGVKVGPPT